MVFVQLVSVFFLGCFPTASMETSADLYIPLASLIQGTCTCTFMFLCNCIYVGCTYMGVHVHVHIHVHTCMFVLHATTVQR